MINTGLFAILIIKNQLLARNEIAMLIINLDGLIKYDL